LTPATAVRAFALLLAGVTAGRLALLLGSQRALNGDDAAIAVMALRIVAGEWPLQASVADSHGGSSLAAYVVAPLFALLGPSEAAFKLFPLLARMAALLLVWTLVRRERGAVAALLVALLFASSVALPRWSFYAAGGYTLCLAWLPLTLLLLLRSARPGGTARDALAVGLACGFGVFLLETFVAAALVCLGTLLLLPAPGRGRRVAACAAGMVVGVAPLAAVGRGAAELQPALVLAGVSDAPRALFRALTHDLVAFHAAANLEGMPPLCLAPNVVAYGALGIGLGLLLLGARPARAEAHAVPSLELVLLAYVSVYLILYALNPRAGEDARFLVPLEPALSMLAGLGLCSGFQAGAWPRAAATAALAMALLNSAAEHARLAGDHRVQGPRGFRHPAHTQALLSHLETRGTRHVFTEEWDHAWRLVFSSRRRIEACHGVSALRDLVASGRQHDARFAVIVSSGSRQDAAVARRLRNEGIASERSVVAGFAVHIFGGPSGPKAPPDWCSAPGYAEVDAA
jgi:hypothetical protein